MRTTVNILIFSCHWRVVFVRSFKQAFEKDKRLSGKVICIDMNPLSSALYEGDYYEIPPAMDDPEFMPFLKNTIKKYDISAIIPSTDKDLLFLSANKKSIEEEQVKIVISDDEVIKTTSDKFSTYTYFVKNEISTPKSWLPVEIKDIKDCDFPLIIKPRFGIGSKDINKVFTREELDFFIGKVDKPIIQKLEDGVEYSFDTLSDFSAIPLEIVPRERISTRSGEIFRGRTVKSKKLIKQVLNLLGKIKIKGPAVIQGFAGKDEKLSFTEINPRFGSGMHLTVQAGANYPLYLLRMLAGLPHGCKMGDFDDNLVMLRYDDAVFIQSNT
ncbi:ATP-grasp domain-containing protein [bacterium]|nr:ATP-grasp domain-containing protein [bacterium]